MEENRNGTESGTRQSAAGGGAATDDGPARRPGRWRTLWDKALGALGGLPQVFGLVWQADRGFTLGLALCTVLTGFVPAATAWVSKLLIDEVVVSIKQGFSAAQTQAIIWLALAQVGVYLFSALLQTLGNINQQLLQELTANRIQELIMRHAIGLDLSRFENPEFYDTLQQAQREANFRPVNMIASVFNLLRSLITFLSMVALITRLGWIVALVALLSPIPSFIASQRYSQQGYKLNSRQAHDRRLMYYFLDLLTKDTYSKEIQLFNLGEHFVGRWKLIARRFYADNRSLVLGRNLVGLAANTVTILAASAAFAFIALQAASGVLTIGDLTLYTQAISGTQASFQTILSALAGLYENNLYLNNLFSFLDYQPKIRNSPHALPIRPPLQQGIEFRNVSFTYPGKREPAIHNLSFKIAPATTTALVGQNGAGKTTVVKLLTRLYEPDEGAILIDGRDIKDYDLASLRALIGVIFQDYVTYFSSAGENIGVGRLAELDNRALIEQAAARSGADRVVARLPKGYDTTLGRWFSEGQQLSGGEWQKIALARAFMRDAEILILDEPTASLDARAEAEIFGQMQQLTSGKMALLISHRFSTVRLADQILVLEGGRLLESGTHAELLALGQTYAELFNLQAASYR